MKPQDIVILLKIIASKDTRMSYRALAKSLGMSASSVSDSLERCKKVQLIDRNKKYVNVMSLKEFLVHGLQYVFPAETGRIVRGVPTYISATPIKDLITNNGESYVWHYAKGTVRGQQIKPLYSSVPEAALKDDELYQLLVITDTIRVGRSREKEIAIEELTKRIDQYVKNQQ